MTYGENTGIINELSLDSIKSYFDVQDQSKCPILRYEIVFDDGTSETPMISGYTHDKLLLPSGENEI